MEKYDFRFDTELFRSFVGKTFNKYVHDKFEYTNTATLYVGIMIDDVSYEFENDYEEVNYFGWDSEATVSRFFEKDWNSIVSAIGDNAVITPVNETIRSIRIINDHFMSHAHGEQNYDWWETRAIIFDFGDHEISFEKQDCWFSMEIEINKGNHLEKKISDGQFILEDFEQSEKQVISTEREIIVL